VTVLLRAAARVEVASLVLLLLNLATVHLEAVSSLLGPVHGAAYLFVIGATWQTTRSRRLRALASVPGIGGLLVLRRTQSMTATTR
jgi:hypothetical protein